MFVFFFKQKTAYEMRISDWSSDVCSSDLAETDLSEELIVTARRQSETITDVPATVNVVSDEALSTRLVGSGLDLSGITPGFQLYNALGGSAAPTIRGLGSNTAVFSIEASVASFFDGVYAAHPRDYVSPIFDVDRIEVIKGTQSTTLGKNITLGAVSFVSRRPGDKLGSEEEHTSELQSLMRISYAVFCLKKKNKQNKVQSEKKHTT